jgi:hypothetical protein
MHIHTGIQPVSAELEQQLYEKELVVSPHIYIPSNDVICKVECYTYVLDRVHVFAKISGLTQVHEFCIGEGNTIGYPSSSPYNR